MGNENKLKELVEAFNAEHTDIPFHLEYETQQLYDFKSAKVTLKPCKYVDNCIIYPTKSWYDMLNAFAARRGHVLRYNNTATTIWISENE